MKRLKIGEPGLTASPQKSPQRRTPLRRTPLRPRAKKKRGPRIDYTKFAIAKQEKPVPVMWVFDDGRVQYNLRHPQGEHLYRCAIAKMWERQGQRCSIGGESITFVMATFEHGLGRNKNRQDDRIDIVDADGYLINSAACKRHNCAKGSRRNYPMALRLRPEDVR